MIAAALLVTLTWSTPAQLRSSCDANGQPIAETLLECAVLELRGQPACYRPGCEDSPACWDSVRAATRPDTVFRVSSQPGKAHAATVAAGQHVAIVRNSRGWSCWSRIVVTP